jgi:cholest-4-en-3-one 26-monooxygenase
VQLADVNLNDLDAFEKQCPHDMFEVLRREAPVFWQEEPAGVGPGYWAITRYDDLKHISRHPLQFSSEKMGAILREPDPATVEFQRQIMLSMDPPRHRQYRMLVNKAFTPRMVDGLRPRIQAMVKDIVNAVIERGECDFVEQLAAPLPMLVICELMGIPEEDRRHVYEIGNKMVGFDDPEYHDGKTLPMKMKENDENMQLSAQMFIYAAKLREKALAHPGDDLGTALVNVELDGRKLTPEEFNFFFLLLLIAGNETTRTVTSNGMVSLMDHPDQLRALKQDISLLDGAVEEILRFSPAVHSFRRTATQPTEIRGQEITEDAKLILWYPSANRDEDVFPDPQRFDIRRTPNDHVAFGYGEHYCLGANLARMELQEIFREVVTRIDGIERTAKPRRLRSNFINGVKEMRVRFEQGPVVS